MKDSTKLYRRALKQIAQAEIREYDGMSRPPRYRYEPPARWERDETPWWSCGHHIFDKKLNRQRFVMLCEACTKCTRTEAEAASYARTILSKLNAS